MRSAHACVHAGHSTCPVRSHFLGDELCAEISKLESKLRAAEEKQAGSLQEVQSRLDTSQTELALLRAMMASKDKEHAAIVLKERAEMQAKACMWFMQQMMASRGGKVVVGSGSSDRSDSPFSPVSGMGQMGGPFPPGQMFE
jgi:hypothetical protein